MPKPTLFQFPFAAQRQFAPRYRAPCRVRSAVDDPALFRQGGAGGSVSALDQLLDFQIAESIRVRSHGLRKFESGGRVLVHARGTGTRIRWRPQASQVFPVQRELASSRPRLRPDVTRQHKFEPPGPADDLIELAFGVADENVLI